MVLSVVRTTIRLANSICIKANLILMMNKLVKGRLNTEGSKLNPQLLAKTDHVNT